MALRSNAQTFQNRTVYLKEKKNMKGSKSGISATISRSCRRSQLPEAAP